VVGAALILTTLLIVASLSVIVGAGARSWTGAPKFPNPSPLPAATSRPLSGLAAADLDLSNMSTIGWINQPGDPDAVAHDSANNAIYVANAGANELSIISDRTNARIGTVTVGNIPVALAYDPTNDEIYVANLGSGNLTNLSAANVSIVSGHTDRVVGWVQLGAAPSSLAYDATNNTILVGEASGNVSILSGTTGEVITVDRAGSYVSGLAYDSTNNTIFVANFLGDNVSILSGSTGREIGSVDVGDNPDGVLYDPDNNQIYVGHELSNNVSIISGLTGRAVGSVNVGSQPTGFAFDPQNDAIFVTNHGSGTISIISGFSDSVVGSVSVGGAGDCPGAAAYDPSNAEVYVADLCASTIAVIANGYPVTVTESGLPFGTYWGVNTWNSNGAFDSETTDLTFIEANGTWNYSVTSDNTSYSAPGGNLSVNGSATSIYVNFRLVTYLVSFAETGLPPNTVWWVILTDGPRFASSESTLIFLEPNGTYPYSTSATGYSSTPGNVTIQGPPAGLVVVHFSPISIPSSSGVPILDYELIGAVIAMGAIGTAVVWVSRRRKTPP